MKTYKEKNEKQQSKIKNDKIKRPEITEQTKHNDLKNK